MRIIQLALEEQGIIAGWRGPDPVNVNTITKSYLDGDYSEGHPRMVRAINDDGKKVVIKQLKEDFIRIKAEQEENQRINAINAKAKELTDNEISINELNAKMIEYNQIDKKDKKTKKDKETLDRLEATLNWYSDVYKVAEQAKNKGISLDSIKWPEKG